MNLTNMQSPSNRRRFIRLVGGGAVAAVMPIAAGCSSVVPENTVQAWATPKAELGLREFMGLDWHRSPRIKVCILYIMYDLAR